MITTELEVFLQSSLLRSDDEVVNEPADDGGHENHYEVAQALRLNDLVPVANQKQKLRYYCDYNVYIPVLDHDNTILKFIY